MYLLPYYAALNINWYTYFAPDFTMSSVSSMSLTSAGVGGSIFAVIIGLSLLLLFIHQLCLYHKFGQLSRGCGFTLGVTMLGASMTVSLLKYDWTIHVHHYAIALLLWPWATGRRRASATFQAILLGLFVNGLAQWGADPLWTFQPATPSAAPSIPWQLEHIRLEQAILTLKWGDETSRPYALYLNNVIQLKGYNVGSANISLPLAAPGMKYYVQVRELLVGKTTTPLVVRCGATDCTTAERRTGGMLSGRVPGNLDQGGAVHAIEDMPLQSPQLVNLGWANGPQRMHVVQQNGN